MRKKWFAILLAMVLVLSCTPTFSLADDVEHIVVWSDNAHEQTVREKQIEEFNNTIGTDYSNTINIALMANDGPDLFRPSTNTFAGYVEAGYAVPISDLEGSEELLLQYNTDELVVGDQLFNGKVQGC